jgi:hypothetical protein
LIIDHGMSEGPSTMATAQQVVNDGDTSLGKKKLKE